ncbi:tRNA uracil 4-sulfurtransferase ThiI [Marinagarivorans algicola]|uniref:tRNA uracil 4-sulfurtransferase ThiI n=1 Tax=Marinagarivorans algicola TaxID=1513270 RepID=UPI0006B6100A|nr:tRNA uracil 4-sulfurtransferase ThiI [Marinagarivorans algicola]
MHFILRLFPEITIKSPSVRKRMARQLADNTRIILRREYPSARVKQDWDKLDVNIRGLEDAVTAKGVSALLSRIPGIANFSRVRIFEAGDLQQIYEDTASVWGEALAGKTFRVRAKRVGEHDFGSIELERYVGGGLNQNFDAAGVNLKAPDVTVHIEVRGDVLYVIEQKTQGLGGFPVGTQGQVLSLVSGGFDSTVASYQCIKRGLRTHYCFFNLGGKAHELGVKELSYYLWNRYGSSHRVRFITVPFEEVVKEIIEKVDPACMGVVLKRMMFRTAEKIAMRAKAEALVTGEAVAQVSSQTLTNLKCIDQATDALVIRPLALMNKGDIIDEARFIGAEALAASIPEYCGVISIKPSASVKMHQLEAAEAHMDMTVLDRALEASKAQLIDEVMADVEKGQAEVDHVAVPQAGDVVVDIRHPDEIEFKPLTVSGALEVIPFYNLNEAYSALDATKRYLLYCDKGVMSQLHASHLKDEGHRNVAVYRP